MDRARNAILTALIVAGVSIPSVVSSQVPYVWVLPTAEVEYASSAPFASLLEHRQALALGSGQVARIQSVRDRLVEDNRPLLAQIRDAEVFGAETAEERAALEAIRNEFEVNARAAEMEVRQLLMPEQIQRADSLLGGLSWTYPVREEEETPRSRAANRAVEPAVLMVENHNYYDANIYVLAGARRIRLGFVTGLGTETFSLPVDVLSAGGGIRFEVVQIPRYVLPPTYEVSAFPGDRVVLRIPPN